MEVSPTGQLVHVNSIVAAVAVEYLPASHPVVVLVFIFVV